MCYYSIHKHNQSIRKTRVIGFCEKYDKYITYKIGNNACFNGNTINCEHYCCDKYTSKKEVEKRNAGIENKNIKSINKLFFLKNEEYKKIDIYADASFSEKLSQGKCGIYIKLNNDIIYSNRIVVEARNSHEAECKAIYEALCLIYDFIMPQRKNLSNINIYSDSESLILQCNAISRIRDINLHMIINRIVEIKDRLCANLNWIPRQFNYIADALSRC